MYFVYEVKVHNFDILLQRMCRTMEDADNMIVFNVHGDHFVLNHEQILDHEEQVFHLKMSHSVNDTIELMRIGAYKIHPVGVKVLLGETYEDITDDANFAYTHSGTYRQLPRKYYLTNPTGLSAVELYCSIQLVRRDDLDFDDL